MIILAVIIVLLALVALQRWRQWPAKVCGIYAGGCLLAAGLLTCLCYFLGTRQDQFAEVWNYKAKAVRYYEYWNEEVSCRHPRMKTRQVQRSRTVSSGSGKNARTRTETYWETEIYQDGWLHSYDVDDHPAHWNALTEYDNERSISNQEYARWRNLWGSEKFVDMHRSSVHTQDGDMYECRWPGTFELIYPIEEVREYENKVRVSNSVFNYPEVDKQTLDAYPRPADKGDTNGIVSYDGVPFSETEQMTVRRVNALLGPGFKVHVIILLFDATRHASADVMNDVLAAWRGPNKNELVVAIGLSTDRQVQWCQPFSWCDDTTVHSVLRQDINGMKRLDFDVLKLSLMKGIERHWHKKSFKDFDYISNPLPTWIYVLYTFLLLATYTGIGWACVAHEDQLAKRFK